MKKMNFWDHPICPAWLEQHFLVWLQTENFERHVSIFVLMDCIPPKISWLPKCFSWLFMYK